MKVPAPFLKAKKDRRRCKLPEQGIRQRDNKNTQKILETHEKFGYNVTIMYSTKYSEL